MMRFNHYLTPNRKSESPNQILFVDTEANIDGEKQTFRLGYAIYWRKERSPVGNELHSVNDFHKLLDLYSHNKKEKLYVFAHNMSYDYTILMIDSYLSSRKREITMRVIDSVFMIKGGNILFLSSTNYYKQSLKQLGEIFGLSKMESPDFSNVTDKDLMAYCQRDTAVLAKIMIDYIAFIKENDLGCFKPTIAGQAFTAFRHRFMENKLLVHDYSEILELEKLSYRGGRNECFRLGAYENIHYLDINSMYPFVMKNKMYPTKPIVSKVSQNVRLTDLEYLIKEKAFILAECELELFKPIIACKRDKLLFPIGKIMQTITSPEIEYLLNHPDAGKIIKINKLVSYHQAKIFEKYVDYFYSMKVNAKNIAEKELAKLFLNSLYGKFGQHNHDDIKIICDETEYDTINKFMNIGNTFELLDLTNGGKWVKLCDKIYHVGRSDGNFARDSIPIIASSVTAYARMYLVELIEIAGWDNVLYCDTDSLFVTQLGYDNLLKSGMINGSELGKLKVEKFGKVVIKGCKDYIFNEEIKIKGVKKDAEMLADGLFKQKHFLTRHTKYRLGIPDGVVIVKDIIKKMSRNYTKGTLSTDGLVHSFKFAEW